MDLQRLQALGAVAVTLSGNTIGADAVLLKAPKYRESAAATAKVDDESQWEIMGYMFSCDTAGKFTFANAAGGGAALVGTTHYFGSNYVSQFIDCMLEMGKGLPIVINGTPTGNFSVTAYVVDRNYKNRFRLPLQT